MTNIERQQIEKDVLYAAETAKRDYELQRAKVAQIGQALTELGNALQSDPELVTPVPEIDGPDFRTGLNLLSKREEVIQAVVVLRDLHQKAKNAAQRKAAVGFSAN